MALAKPANNAQAIRLNPQQQEAVDLPADRNALILAGAGSGKTLVLTQHYNKLVCVDKFSPEEILSITFTNKAASEMRRRIMSVTDLRYTTSWIGTFHGIANRVLRRHHDMVGLRRNYTIIDRHEQISVLKKLHKEKFNVEIEKENLIKCADAISRFKERAVRADQVEGYIDTLGHSDFHLKRYVEIYRAYEAYCREESLVDFPELILSFYELLDRDDRCLDYLTRQIKTVLVDEFQDTNDLQFKLVCRLCRHQQSIFVVGDDDQLIYSWRGADPENMRKMLEYFSNVRVIRLEQNYRSTQEILDIANTLIQNNSNRMPKKLWSEHRQANNIVLKNSIDEYVESTLVRQAVSRWHKQGIPYREIAILYRKTFLARNLENILGQGGIPYEIHGGARFIEREEVRNAMAWLKVCLDPDDDYCVQRVINVPTRGIGAATLNHIKQRAKSKSINFYRSARELSKDKSLMTRTRHVLGEFVMLIDQLTTYRHLHPRALLEKIFQVTGLLEYYKSKTSKDIEYSREENLLELLTAVDEFVNNRKAAAKKSEQGNGSFDAALKEIAPDDYSTLTASFVSNTTLDNIEPEHAGSSSRDAVQLMTIHAAKGLEFRCVILCGLEEGILPHLAHGDDDNSEEERRLCYVAITRARNNLMLSSVCNRNVRGKYSLADSSRFIREMFGEEPPLSGHEPRA